jgi:hypothetical protein
MDAATRPQASPAPSHRNTRDGIRIAVEDRPGLGVQKGIAGILAEDSVIHSLNRPV